MKYIDDIADEATENGGEESVIDSTKGIFRGADARDYHIAHAIESLNHELSRAPTMSGRIILLDTLSRSPTPPAPYQPEPMPAARAPSPRAAMPLFMPMSEDEDDTNRIAKPCARRAPSPDRSCRSTAKRRRIEPTKHNSLKAFAKTFLDLEAEDDTDEEDDDEGVPMADFIDDDPVDDEVDHPVVVVDDHDSDDEHGSALQAERDEALAAHFVEMARKNRPLLDTIDSSPHDIVSRIPHSKDPDLYRFSVPRGSQLKLLQYLYRCTGVKSVFFRERGAGGRKHPRFETVAVYVETNNLAALEQAMAKYVGGYAMLSRKPIPIDVQDRVSTLNFAQTTSLVGRWARVRSGSSLYQGDLVFVENESDYLVVPRVVYERLSQTPGRPPARLFDGDECAAAGNKVQKMNKYWVWRRRTFIHGLEQRSYVPSQLTVEGVVPTVDEQQWARFDQHRALFNGSSYPALVAPFIGPCCALQEGDRIVVVSGKHSGKTGYIVAVTNTQLRDVNTQRQHVVRLAAILERYDGVTAITRSSLQMAGNPALFVPVSALRLHALSFVRRLLVGDRVVAVGGAAQGISGRIESMNESSHITFRPSPPIENADATMEIEMCDLRLEFRVGDVARVNRNFPGIQKGTVGFITEVCAGGFVHFYQCALPRLLSAMTRRPREVPPTVLIPNFASTSDSEAVLQIAGLHTSSTKPDMLNAQATRTFQNPDCESADFIVAEEPLIYIPTTHLDFALVDDNGLAVHSSVSPSVRQELDEMAREWEKMKMSTGRAYIGCEIMVAGKQSSYARKGLFGTVLGYKFTKPRLRKTREQRLKDGRTSAGPDVELHVRYDGSMEGVPVKLDQVVERFSRLPLEHVMHLRGMFEIMAKHRQAQNKEERIEDRPLLAPKDSWFETSREPERLGHIYGPPRDIGEQNGHWLRHNELVGKRIDIKIEGVPACLRQYGRCITPMVLTHEGKRGFVNIARPLSVNDIEKKLLECRTIPMHHLAKVPPASIKPYRLAEPDSSGTAHCISSVVGRVIIIGPNVHGVTDRVGQYAETMPSAPAHAPLPTPIVEVRFPLTPSGERPPNEEYHLESLCRALNETLHSCGISATDFDAVQTKW